MFTMQKNVVIGLTQKQNINTNIREPPEVFNWGGFQKKWR